MKNKFEYKIYGILFLLIGILIGVLFSMFGIEIIAENIKILVIIFISIVLIFTFFFVIIYLSRDSINNYIFQKKDQYVTSTKEELSDLCEAIIETDHSKIRTTSSTLISRASEWYLWLNYRKLVLSAISILFLTFGSLLGAALLFKQNNIIDKQTSILNKQSELIADQNKRLEQQTYLQEAERRSSLVYMFSDIMESMDDEIKTNKSNRILSDQLQARVISISKVLKPYKFLENDKLIGEELSPERAQLLVSLIETKLDANAYQFLSLCDFSFADLRRSTFEFNFDGVFISNTNWTNSTLSNSSFHWTWMQNSIFNNVNFERVEFNNCPMDNSYFNETKLFDASFLSSSARESIFSNITTANRVKWNSADLSGSEFENCRLVFNQFIETNLIDTKFDTSCYFHGTSFDTISYSEFIKLNSWVEKKYNIDTIGNFIKLNAIELK